MKKLTIFIIFLILFSCKSQTDPVTGEKILIEPNADKRARAEADKGGGIFGDINNKKKDQISISSFANSNPLWRATLKSLDFIPLISADYLGGIIIYDWYSESLNSNEQIKISVKFLGSELKSSSIEISAHRKKCDELTKCTITKADNKFSNEIKDTIINTARAMMIEEKKRELK